MEPKFLTARYDHSMPSVKRNDSICVPWWSFTKTVMAAAALKLVAQGHLVLDEPIKHRGYTLRQLLQHRAGLRDYGGLASYHEAVQSGDKPWSIEQLHKETRADDLEYDPGEGWRYSNIGYQLVRFMIENAMGQTLDKALKQLFFDDLGLNTVRLAKTPEDLNKLTWGNPKRYHPGWVYHGLLIGSPDDAVCFLHRLMVGDVLPRDLLNQMTTAHPLGGPLPGRPWQTTGYGLGLMIGQISKAGLAIGHSGVGPGSLSAIYHFADRDVPHTVASFARGHDEGANEYEVIRLSQAV